MEQCLIKTDTLTKKVSQKTAKFVMIGRCFNGNDVYKKTKLKILVIISNNTNQMVKILVN